MKKPFIYSAIAFVLFLFGCEEEYDKSGIYSVDIVTMNKTDAYAVVDYRTLCGSDSNHIESLTKCVSQINILLTVFE